MLYNSLYSNKDVEKTLALVESISLFKMRHDGDSESITVAASNDLVT